MAHVTATLSNYRQSPRKVRLVANYVKGKTVAQALAQLSLLPKRASDPVAKLVSSALANAKNAGYNESDLKVLNLTVDEGAILYRRRARARGRAAPIRKRTSHLKVTLLAPDMVKEAKEEKKTKAPAKKAETKAKAKPTTKKPVAKKAAPKKTSTKKAETKTKKETK